VPHFSGGEIDWGRRENEREDGVTSPVEKHDHLITLCNISNMSIASSNYL
jgi:hypothetical protein